MFNKIFKKKKNNNVDDKNILIAALLVHAAKIDNNYTNKEKQIIKKAIVELSSKNEKIDEILLKAEELERESNQILDFTKEFKNLDENSKIKIIESLWNIIYSDKNSDMYENNLMRRLTGLLYLNPKIVGDLKKKIKNNLE